MLSPLLSTKRVNSLEHATVLSGFSKHIYLDKDLSLAVLGVNLAIVLEPETTESSYEV